MQLGLNLNSLIEELVFNFSKFIIMLHYLSERFERAGLKNISRFMKAVAYSRQTLIMKLYRNLKLNEDSFDVIKANFDSYYRENNKIVESIKEFANKENLPGLNQTMYFAQETSKNEQLELDKIFSFAQNMKDTVYKQIVVCPLCGLVITDEVERCPLCGANKAIFKAF